VVQWTAELGRGDQKFFQLMHGPIRISMIFLIGSPARRQRLGATTPLAAAEPVPQRVYNH